MKNIALVLFTLLLFFQTEAQTIKQKSIDISIGFGFSFPFEDIDVGDSGFYLQGEYVLELSKWIDFRPYAGIILTKSDGEDLNGNPTEFISTTEAFLIGGKTRITIPIPWVSPYIEGGIGASIGSFRTYTPLYDIDKSGLVLHFPFTLGLELGPKHNFDIAFTYYFQSSVEQFAGAAAFGVSIPLD